MGRKPEEQPQFIALLEDEPLWGDEEDTLGIDPFAEVIAKSVIGTQGPFTIGAYGGWGVGKTTLLRQAKAKAEKIAPNSVFVWFNAWQYEREEHPLMPLLASILREIEDKANKDTEWAKQFAKPRQTFRNVLLSLFGGVKFKAGYEIPFTKVHGLKGEINFDSDDAKKRYDEISSEYESTVVAGMYYDAFSALTNATKADNWPKGIRVVLFIDDLDRCHPDKALLLLDAIKLILSQRNFIFVLGLEPKVLTEYLISRYRDDFKVGSEEEFGKRYLDKIIQLPFWVPRHGTRFSDYAAKLIAKVQDDDIRPAFEQAKEALVMATDENPRSLVRLLNHLILSANLWRAMKKEPAISDGDVVPAMIVSAVLHEKLDDKSYRRLCRSASLCEAINKRLNGGSDTAEDGQRQIEDFLKLDTVLDGLLTEIEKHELLLELLKSEAGGVWLCNSELRSAIEELLTPPQKQEAPEDQRKIVEDAIRESLRKSDSQPLARADYLAVNELDVSESSLNDKGLRLVSECKNLQELYCYNTQVSSLEPLSGLTTLHRLDCDNTQVSSLEPLSGLTSLQELYCSYTLVSSLEPLSGLTSLQTLNCSGTQVSSLEPLSGLTSLQTLYCFNTLVSSLEPLSGLTSLQELYCYYTQVSSLKPLSGLTSLHRLDCDNTQVSSLGPLSGLTSLQELYCSYTQVSSLEPLSGLTSLQELYCSYTLVSSLEPLSGLTSLQTLNCSGTQVSSLEPLSGLTSLQTLYCFNTLVSSLEPLSGLTSLQELYCYYTQVSSLEPLSGLSSLHGLFCFNTLVSSLEPLSGLTSLRYLRISRNKEMEESAKSLQAKLKNLKIEWIG